MTGVQGIGSGMETAAAREGMETAPFATALLEAAAVRPEIVGLSADLAKYTDMGPFAERYPDRFVNVGMAEQSLMAVSAGLAHEGLLPVATTYCVFASRRALDFLEIQIALMRRNVKIVAGLPGLTTGYGGTHQGIDDLAVIRAVPNMTVLDPADAVEIRDATAAMIDHEGPVYMRLQRGNVPVLGVEYAEPFRIGRARLARAGADVAIIAAGVMVGRALVASDALAAEGISAAVLNAASVKPFDAEAVVRLAGTVGCLVTAENHTVIGGLFGAVAETLARAGIGVPVVPVGIADEFCGYGSLPYLAERHRLTADAIAAAARAGLGLGPAREGAS
jgi:transketolase